MAYGTKSRNSAYGCRNYGNSYKNQLMEMLDNRETKKLKALDTERQRHADTFANRFWELGK